MVQVPKSFNCLLLFLN